MLWRCSCSFYCCRFQLRSSVWRCLQNRFVLILQCLIPSLISLYFCVCSLPAFMPHAFSLVHMSDVVHFQFIHVFSCPLSLFLFCCSSLSAFCFIILGSGVSVDTSTPIRASINLQQCLTCVCVCMSMLTSVFHGCLKFCF